MFRITKEVKNVAHLIKEITHPERSIYRVGRVENQTGIQYVRQFAFEVYVKRGEIPAHLLTKDGMLPEDKDPYVGQSVYFAVFDTRSKKIVAASRLILPVAGKGARSLQIDVTTLGVKAQAYVAEREHDTIAEPASYAKAPGAPWVVTLYLLREMLHYSLDNGIGYWLVALNPHIERTYVRRFGGAMHKLGSKVYSKVDLDGRRPKNTPYIIDVPNALRNLSTMPGYQGWLLTPLVKKFFQYKLHMTDRHVIRAH